MPDRHIDHLLIGGGVASVACAEALSEEGATGSLMLVSRELDPPYHRPPVSKAYLTGRESREDAYLYPRAWYDEAGIELLTRTSVLALDPGAKVARLSTKEELSYGSALLATGAMVRRLQVEGAQLEGIHYLRALGNADAVRADTESADRVVCVGGSYIGCEVAASLSGLGKACTVVMLEDEPMINGFGAEVGRYVRGLLEGHGIDVISGAEVSHFLGGSRVEQVVLKDGRQLAADVVVCGTGAVPDVSLAARAGVTIGPKGGILCDAYLQTTFDGLFAAGDACEFESAIHGGTARIEHERVAETQGRAAGRNMLGAGEAYREVPYFWSDLADWSTIEYVGLGGARDEEVVRGDPALDSFSAFHLLGGSLVGAVTVGKHSYLDEVSRLIASGGAVSADELSSVGSRA